MRSNRIDGSGPKNNLDDQNEGSDKQNLKKGQKEDKHSKKKEDKDKRQVITIGFKEMDD